MKTSTRTRILALLGGLCVGVVISMIRGDKETPEPEIETESVIQVITNETYICQVTNKLEIITYAEPVKNTIVIGYSNKPKRVVCTQSYEFVLCCGDGYIYKTIMTPEEYEIIYRVVKRAK